MKILKVRFKNLRAYRDQNFQFHPNINAIFGDSDAGKSAFISGLRFAILNQYSKRIKTIGCKDECSVIVSDGKNHVKRVQGKVNGYVIKENGINYSLEAIGTDLPQKVQEVFRIHPTNIQTQKEVYFLIDKTPGQISKQLNQVSGLSEIDSTIKLATQEVNSISSAYRDSKKKIEEEKEKIKNTEWAIKASKELSILEKKESDLEKLKNELDNLSYLILRYVGVQDSINSTLPESIINDYCEITSLVGKLSKHEQYIAQFSEVVEGISKTIKELKVNIDRQSDFNKVQESFTELQELISEINSIQHWVSLIEGVNSEIKLRENSLLKTQEELSKIKLCPTCKRPI